MSIQISSAAAQGKEVEELRKLRVGIIGAGRISDAHAEGYLRLSDRVSIVAVASARLDHARSRAHQWGATYSFDSIDDLLTGCETDAVDICLPHHLHLEAVRKACAHGKHILLEKPMARSLDEADELLATVKTSGVRFMVAHNHVFNPIVQKAKEVIRKGLIGRVHLAKASSFGWFFFLDDDFRKSYERTGGGILIDTGLHLIYILQYLLGDIESVTTVQGRLVRREMEAEDTAILALRFAVGALGEITVSYASKVPDWEKGFPAGWEQSVNILGTEGALSLSLTKDSLRYYSEAEMPSTLRPLSGWTAININNAYASSFHAEVKHFVESIANSTEPEVGGEEGRKVLEVIGGAYRSARESRTIYLDNRTT